MILYIRMLKKIDLRSEAASTLTPLPTCKILASNIYFGSPTQPLPGCATQNSSSRKSGKSGSKHKNDLQEARSARLASSQVSSPHASRTCTCLAHTHSLRPRRMSTHAQHVGFSRVVDAFCIATMRRAACSMHSICPARDPYASRAHSRSTNLFAAAPCV